MKHLPLFMKYVLFDFQNCPELSHHPGNLMTPIFIKDFPL